MGRKFAMQWDEGGRRKVKGLSSPPTSKKRRRYRKPVRCRSRISLPCTFSNFSRTRRREKELIELDCARTYVYLLAPHYRHPRRHNKASERFRFARYFQPLFCWLTLHYDAFSLFSFPPPPAYRSIPSPVHDHSPFISA
jgi:hypothetical protein